jgi:hypothetical protein
LSSCIDPATIAPGHQLSDEILLGFTSRLEDSFETIIAGVYKGAYGRESAPTCRTGDVDAPQE